jgi:hypothetical protein
MIELAHSGLSQEEGYESFVLKFKHEGYLIPSKWIKIVPIRPWNDSYNISIWFIHLKGIDEKNLLSKCEKDFLLKNERDSLKNWVTLTRRHFKQESLSFLQHGRITNLELPLVTSLFEQIIAGEYIKSLETVDILAKEESFNSWLEHQICTVEWTRIDMLDKEIENQLRVMNHNMKCKISQKENKKEKQSTFKESPIDIDIHPTNNIQIRDVRNQSEQFISPLNLNDHQESGLSVNDLDDDDLDLESELSGFSMFSACESIKSNKKVDYLPIGRGGHSMVVDEENDKFYMFGGWDGSNDLNDFWSFDMKTEKWQLLPTTDRTPSKRSCHKMVLDSKNRKIFLLGKYSPPKETQLDKALYEYNLNSSTWKTIEVNVELKDGKLITGGPGQVFDHAMIYDQEDQAIFVFGGVKAIENEVTNKYNGLWKLNLKGLYYWEYINTDTSDPYELKLKTRGAHSMVLSRYRELIIWGGNKGPRKFNASNCLFDMTSYNLNNGKVYEYFHDYSKNGPNVNFSSCSFYDSLKNEIFIFGGGLINEKTEYLTNSFWIYNFDKEFWIPCVNKSLIDYDTMIHLNNLYYSYFPVKDYEKVSNSIFPQESLNEPSQRYAHCMVYSNKLKKGYIFGGNSNLRNSAKNVERLDDLWSFKLKRKEKVQLVHEIKFKLLENYFIELCQNEEIKEALEVLDKLRLMQYENNLNKLNNVNDLSFNLVSCDKSTNISDRYQSRYELFEKILEFISPFKYENQNLQKKAPINR